MVFNYTNFYNNNDSIVEESITVVWLSVGLNTECTTFAG